MPRRSVQTELRPRIRASRGDVILIGPGKADLLEAIGKSGSIRSAAEEIGMSYMRAWTLVRTMNDSFAEPLVQPLRGGARHGGAVITPLGLEVLALYREMESRALRAIAPSWKKIERHLK